MFLAASLLFGSGFTNPSLLYTGLPGLTEVYPASKSMYASPHAVCCSFGWVEASGNLFVELIQICARPLADPANFPLTPHFVSDRDVTALELSCILRKKNSTNALLYKSYLVSDFRSSKCQHLTNQLQYSRARITCLELQ